MPGKRAAKVLSVFIVFSAIALCSGQTKAPDELARMQKQVNDAVAAIEELRQANARLEKMLVTRQEESGKLQGRIDELHIAMGRLHDEVDELSQRSTQERGELEAQVGALRVENNLRKLENQGLRGQVNRLAQRSARQQGVLEAQIRALKAQKDRAVLANRGQVVRLPQQNAAQQAALQAQVRALEVENDRREFEERRLQAEVNRIQADLLQEQAARAATTVTVTTGGVTVTPQAQAAAHHHARRRVSSNRRTYTYYVKRGSPVSVRGRKK